MEIKFNVIKKLLLKEYEQMYKETYQIVQKNTIADSCLEMVRNGFYVGRTAIESAKDFEELESALSTCGYRITLQEWIDSY